MHPNLSFEQAPPIGVPFRFFLTAPWFGVGVGALLLLSGPDALASRWTGEALAVTHGLVLGVLLQVMTGALFQFVPVAAGGNLWRAPLVAAIVHPAFALAAILLMAGFLLPSPLCLGLAATLMAMAGFLFAAVLLHALWTTPAVGPPVINLRGAAIGLAATFALGVFLAWALAIGTALPLIDITHAHMAWGFAGWALLLLAGAAAIVVPMFQMTPQFPAAAAKAFPWLILGGLGLWTARLLNVPDLPTFLGLALVLMLAAVYAITVLRLQGQRRRKVEDANSRLFRWAMFTMLLAIGVVAWGLVALPGSDENGFPLAAGVLLVAPFVFVGNGMLYKIVPFLNWLHLQRLGGIHRLPPNMNRMIPAAAMERQAKVQLAAFALLLAATQIPALVRAAGLGLIISFGWLGLNLVGAVRTYRNFRDQMCAAVPDRQS